MADLLDLLDLLGLLVSCFFEFVDVLGSLALTVLTVSILLVSFLGRGYWICFCFIDVVGLVVCVFLLLLI